MDRQDRINKLIKHCKELARLNEYAHKRSDNLALMAKLAKAGQKNLEQFKKLEREHGVNCVVDFSNEINNIVNTVKYL